MLWGFSPPINFIELIQKNDGEATKRELNVLIIGAGDARHILQTMAKNYVYGGVVVNFYVIELIVDLIARQMLLLTLALEPPEEMTSAMKTSMWTEVYGNALVTPQTAEYIIRKANQLVHMVTDPEFLSRRMPCLSLDEMKYKEKDALENIFRFWEKSQFNVGKNWDERLRKSLGTRYDSRNGVFDWDYHMSLKSVKGGERVNECEYKQWRTNGVAFSWLEREYIVSNPTFAMGVFADGDEIYSHGFLGDMEVSPYFTFGQTCDDKDMLAMTQTHERPIKRASDITERNLRRIFHEIEHKSPYVHTQTNERDLGTVVVVINQLETETPTIRAQIDKAKENYTPIEAPHKIIFLPTTALNICSEKAQYQSFFDAAFVASNLQQKLFPKVFSMMKNNAVVVLETRKVYFNLSDDTQKQFEESIRNLMKESQCEEYGKCDFKNDFTATYKVNRH